MSMNQALVPKQVAQARRAPCWGLNAKLEQRFVSVDRKALLGAGNGGVDELSGEYGRILGGQDNRDVGKLGALALVNAHGVDRVVAWQSRWCDGARRAFAVFKEDAQAVGSLHNGADVAVKELQVVVVDAHHDGLLVIVQKPWRCPAPLVNLPSHFGVHRCHRTRAIAMGAEHAKLV